MSNIILRVGTDYATSRLVFIKDADCSLWGTIWTYVFKGNQIPAIPNANLLASSSIFSKYVAVKERKTVFISFLMWLLEFHEVCFWFQINPTTSMFSWAPTPLRNHLFSYFRRRHQVRSQVYLIKENCGVIKYWITYELAPDTSNRPTLQTSGSILHPSHDQMDTRTNGLPPLFYDINETRCAML